MKQIVNETANTGLENVTAERYYGCTCIDGKAFIARENYHEGDYIVRSLEFLTRGNSYAAFNRPTLKESIGLLLKNGYKVFEFNTYRELFKWLVE